MVAAVLSALNSVIEGTAYFHSRALAGSGARQGILQKAGNGQAVSSAATGLAGTVSADQHLIAALFCLVLCAACVAAILYIRRKSGDKISGK